MSALFQTSGRFLSPIRTSTRGVALLLAAGIMVVLSLLFAPPASLQPGAGPSQGADQSATPVRLLALHDGPEHIILIALIPVQAGVRGEFELHAQESGAPKARVVARFQQANIGGYRERPTRGTLTTYRLMRGSVVLAETQVDRRQQTRVTFLGASSRRALFEVTRPGDTTQRLLCDVGKPVAGWILAGETPLHCQTPLQIEQVSLREVGPWQETSIQLLELDGRTMTGIDDAPLGIRGQGRDAQRQLRSVVELSAGEARYVLAEGESLHVLLP